MPKGTTVELSENYGRSRFTSTGRVSVILPNGIRERFFLKVQDLGSVGLEEAITAKQGLNLECGRRRGSYYASWRIHFDEDY